MSYLVGEELYSLSCIYQAIILHLEELSQNNQNNQLLDNTLAEDIEHYFCASNEIIDRLDDVYDSREQYFGANLRLLHKYYHYLFTEGLAYSQDNMDITAISKYAELRYHLKELRYCLANVNSM